MGFYDKLKTKLFPDEQDTLYYTNTNDAKKEEKSAEQGNRFYTPTNFSQTRLLSDKLKAGNTITIDVSNMDKKEAIRMIDFLGGVMYAMDGDMKKISRNIFEFSTIKNEK